MLSPKIIELLLAFRKDRDWEQFHSPRNLSTALSVEASELLEHFVWTSDDQAAKLVAEHLQEITSEIADITILLTYLAHDLSIDLNTAVLQKIEFNGLKYPVEKSRGSNKKYTEL